MSDILNIQPNAGQTPNEDTTFEIEGYDTHVQNLEKQYPFYKTSNFTMLQKKCLIAFGQDKHLIEQKN